MGTRCSRCGSQAPAGGVARRRAKGFGRDERGSVTAAAREGPAWRGEPPDPGRPAATGGGRGLGGSRFQQGGDAIVQGLATRRHPCGPEAEQTPRPIDVSRESVCHRGLAGAP